MLIPVYLVFNSHKFYTLVLPDEGYAFFKNFSQKNVLIVHDYREVFSRNNQIKILFLKNFNKNLFPSKIYKKPSIKIFIYQFSKNIHNT